MHIIIAPDKFKGSLTSIQVAESIRNGLEAAGIQQGIEIFPMADGGDGFAAVMKYYLKTETAYCNTVDPFGRNITASYEWDTANKLAIIELAAASGLTVLHTSERNPLYTSTYGSGLLIKHAIEKGAATIMLGLGGSATNDAGTGILAALGFIFKDEKENVLVPCGNNMQHIKSIQVPSQLPVVQFIIATDVSNVLLGNYGAAKIFAPQKGADENAVKILEKGVQQVAAVIKKQTGKNVSAFHGSGAAGGVAAGLAAFFSIQIHNGASLVIDKSNVEKRFPGADIIITGEGRLDEQSVNGKLVQQIAALSKKYNKRLAIICGENTLTKKATVALGISSVYSLINEGITQEYAIANAGSLITKAAVLLVQQHIKNK